MIAVVVAGATGLVGGLVVQELLRRNDVHLTTLVRRATGLPGELLFDFDEAGDYRRLGGDIPCDVLLCCLGTTLHKAGSREAFRRVDAEYVTNLGEALAARRPRARFAVVSSVGAGRPAGFYLSVKAAMERSLQSLDLQVLILRPGLLLGERTESRTLESLGQHLGRPALRLARCLHLERTTLLGALLPTPAEAVARAMIHWTLDEPREGVIENTEILGKAGS